MELCIVPDCQRNAHSRGLCSSHYQTAWQLVTARRTSWRRLEQTGKALEAYSQKRAAKSMDFFMGESSGNAGKGEAK